jgi:site-specific recombinase XerD
LPDHTLCLRGIRESHFPIARSICGCAPLAGRSGVGEITAHGPRHSAATILLNHVGKDLREIQELLRHKNIRTTVRYTHVGYEQTRQTAEALSRALQ